MNLRLGGWMLAFASLSLTPMLVPSPSRAAIELVGVEEAIFDWTPAPGAVTHYGVYVAYNGDDFPPEPDRFVPASRPSVTIDAVYGESAQVRVAAFYGPLRGTLSDVSPEVVFVEPMVVQDSRAYGPEHGPIDLDGDGYDDAVYHDEANGTVRARPSRSFGAGPQTLAPAQDGAWHLVASGDYDGDGRADLFWRNLISGENRIWYLDGLSHDEAPTWPMPDLAWHVLTTADFDGDGRDDVLWHHVRNDWLLIWISGDSPTGHVFNDARALPAGLGRGWELSACGDFDGDGDNDLYWSHESRNEHRMWLLDPPDAVEVVVAPAPSSRQRVRGVGDYDGDGNDDLLWRDTETGWSLIRYPSRPPGLQDEYLAQIGLEWVLASSGDLNGDGRADLVWKREEGGDALVLWMLNGTKVVIEADVE